MVTITSRAINIFFKNNINTSALNKNVLKKIIKLFESEGFDFNVDYNLKMIMINNLNKKRYLNKKKWNKTHS